MHGIERSRTASRKWVIVHGHFYQPPRENPWLDTIETQPSAAPFHDWNERIYAECYRPNGFSRLLDPDRMIAGINNNYQSMSYNFGPTLMEWIEEHHPATTQRIINGDQLGAKANNGHGNAIGQVYNHIIMPLASRRDQLTQIRWAKQSFRKTFGRDPEGLWLAETAINMETVGCLVEEKISFVVLAPQQADAFKSLDTPTGEWTSTAGRPIDTRRPYRLFLRNSNGKKEGGFIDVFFFDEPLSKEISFNDLLQDASTLGRRIDACYSPAIGDDEVVVIATDGETFGHHKAFGDMCLAYFFNHVAPALNIQPINFGNYLELHPPRYEVSLKNAFGEGTAWSCAHGVGRWARDCGCQTGGQPTWNQAWRAPLREALDALQESIDDQFIAACREAGTDPWMLRDAFYGASREVSPKRWERFIAAKCRGGKLSTEQSRRLRRLCEAQKYMLFSYTSCGWFFADISGIEPMQNLAYAARAIQLGIAPARQPAVLKKFMHDLAKAKSNINNDTGATLFERHILPFFNHERMLCFSMALEHALGIATGKAIERYGYRAAITGLDSSGIPGTNPERRPGDLQLFRVDISHDRRGETGEWLVILELIDGAEPAGWVLPPDDPAAAASLTLRQLKEHPRAQSFTPAEIFQSLRHDLSSVYLDKISGHSGRPFSTWFNANRKDLSLLYSFHTDIPDHFRAPMQFIFEQKWNVAISRLGEPGNEDECISELTLLYDQSRYLNLSINLKSGAAFLEPLICEELARLGENCSDTRQCDRIRYLLNIVDRFSLPVSKHRLEDMFFPILSGPVKALYREVMSSDEASDAEKKAHQREVLLKLLNFARRMNFSTREFPLP